MTIKEAREQARVSQRALATALGVRRFEVIAMEQGKPHPEVEAKALQAIRKIALSRVPAVGA